MSSFAEKTKQWVFDHKYGLLAIAVVTLLSVILYQDYLFSDEMLLAQDQLRGYGGWAYYKHQLQQGIIPFWSDGFLAGMPSYESLPGDALYPPFIVALFLTSPTNLHGSLFFLHTILAGVLAYFFLRKGVKLGPMPSILIGALYMLNTNFVSHAHPGHTGKYYVLSWLPLGLYFLFSLLEKNRWKDVIGLGAFVGIAMFTSHVQYVYFVLMGFFVYYMVPLFLDWKRKKDSSLVIANRFGKFWAGIFLGLALGMPILWPGFSYSTEYSIRGSESYTAYEHAISWSAHPEEIASLVVPEFTGYLEQYWGRNFFKLNSEYPGLTILVFGIVGLVLMRRSRYWLAATVGLLSVIYALADHTPFFRIFYHVIPGVDRFRASSMILFWLATSLFLMTAWFWREGIESEPFADEERKRKYGRRLMIAAGVVFGLGVLLSMSASGVYGFWNTLFIEVQESQRFQLQERNIEAAARGFFRTGLLAGALLAVLGAFYRGSLAKGQMLAAIALVSAVDLYAANWKFIQTVDDKRIFPEISLFRELAEADTTNYRVFDLPSAFGQEQGFTGLYGFRTVTGFYDNELKWYRNFHGQGYANFMQGLKVVEMPKVVDGKYVPGTVEGSEILDLMNVKYLLVKDQQGNPQYLRNRSKMPYAYWVGSARALPEDQVLSTMTSDAFDPRREVLLLEEDSMHAVSGQAGIVEAEAHYGNSMITLEVDAPDKGILVVSEVYYPKWKAELDGRPVEMLRVNYTLRGIPVEKGRHTIVLRYLPDRFIQGWIACAAAIVILIGMGVMVSRGRLA